MNITKDSFDYPAELTKGYEVVVLSSFCQHRCFANHGGCASMRDEREVVNISKIVGEIKDVMQVNPAAKIFLAAPNFLAVTPLPGETKNQHLQILQALINKKVPAYLRIDATVVSFLDKMPDFFLFLKQAGIREVWLGVESVDKALRDKYYKPEFTNQQLIEVTQKLRYFGIKACWYIVTGFEDSDATVQTTVEFIKKVRPDKIWVTEAIPCERGSMEIKWEILKSKIEDIQAYRKIYTLLAAEINRSF